MFCNKDILFHFSEIQDGIFNLWTNSYIYLLSMSKSLFALIFGLLSIWDQTFTEFFSLIILLILEFS
jgi:transcription elongation factor GreA-like protein